MSILSDNIRYLGSQLGFSQQKVADDLIITRGRYAKYEDGASKPLLGILSKISRYYHISIDLMISIDLRRISLKEILELADNRILLPILVDGVGRNNIEIIPHRASVGYAMDSLIRNTLRASKQYPSLCGFRKELCFSGRRLFHATSQRRLLHHRQLSGAD